MRFPTKVRPEAGLEGISIPLADSWEVIDLWWVGSYCPGQDGTIQVNLKCGRKVLVNAGVDAFDKVYDKANLLKTYVLTDQI